MKKNIIYIALIAGIISLVIFSSGCNNKKRDIDSLNVDSEVKIDSKGQKYIVDPSKLQSGGPPKDGIPSIDEPKFIKVNEADFLNDNELVLGLDYNGVVKAYPFQILVWHEIVNDFANDKPILVTYCPLCGTGIAFNRQLDGETVEFGVSGKLYNSDLVMYDRKTDSYWQQLTGEAIVGELSGMMLEKIPIDTVTWGEWRAKHPDTLVLSRNTGFIRPYGSSPYGDYDSSQEIYFPVDNLDKRLHPKAFVYGIDINGKYKAYPWDEVKNVRVINDEFAGKRLLIVSTETNAVRVYDRKQLEFKIINGKLVDNNGNELNLDGSGDMEGLEEIIGVNSFWFAWAAFHPETELFIAE